MSNNVRWTYETRRLLRELPNPRADGRNRRDWRKAKSWPGGTVFVLGTHRADGTMHSISSLNDPYTEWDRDVFNAIVEASEVIPETPGALVARLCQHGAPRGFLEYLMTSGRMSLKEFEDTWNAWMDS
jgi:hypothetical protein